MRHFADCDHWSRNDDGSWIGEPAFLASDEQMASLPPCKDCVYRAEQSGNDRLGPRLSTAEPEQTVSPSDAPLPVLLDLDGTDVTATVKARREQAYLRRHLLAGATERECALCGRLLPGSFLVAAHIVPRRHLDDAQRLDFASAAMLACALGCDTLFELGYVVVGDDGTLAVGKSATGALADAVGALGGRQCGAFNGTPRPTSVATPSSTLPTRVVIRVRWRARRADGEVDSTLAMSQLPCRPRFALRALRWTPRSVAMGPFEQAVELEVRALRSGARPPRA